MCEDNRNRGRSDRDFRNDRYNHEDCHCNDINDFETDDYMEQTHSVEHDNPVDFLKESILDLTEDAFQELLFDKVKILLDKKMGKKIDGIAEVVVEHFIKMREAETKAVLDEDAFDKAFEEELKK